MCMLRRNAGRFLRVDVVLDVGFGLIFYVCRFCEHSLAAMYVNYYYVLNMELVSKTNIHVI